MSRLDSFIRRVTAQRDCLNRAAELVRDLPGPALELGLGNGRTFDHLRSLMPERDIFVFDKQVRAHPDCIPDPEFMILGDFRETLPVMLARLPEPAVLAHCDIGTGDKAQSLALAEALTVSLPALLGPGAVIVSDQPFTVAKWEALELPGGVQPGRYYMYRQK
ncbi:MAG: hypothetical protein EP348_08125 [Alphaproteobacteria bacterium]|nr:MAG: hypothetical protein EP348_08125 [Alphaproteobacteria bacterium]